MFVRSILLKSEHSSNDPGSLSIGQERGLRVHIKQYGVVSFDAGFKPTVCTFEEMGERAVIFWVGGNYFSFPFSLADFVIFLSEHGSWVMGHVEHDPSRHQISHQDQNEFMFPTLIKLVFSHLCQCTMRHPNIIKYNCSGCATNMSSIKNNLCSHKRPCSPQQLVAASLTICPSAGRSLLIIIIIII